MCGLRGRGPTDEGSSALLEGVRNSRGPSAIDSCERILDNALLLEALRGNTSVKKLNFSTMPMLGESYEDRMQVPMQVPMQALAENLGLVELDFRARGLNDDTFSSMCESLATHQALETLGLVETLHHDAESTSGANYEQRKEQRKTSRTNALVDMLRSNTKITSVELTRDEFDESLLDNEVYPRLKINKYRPRFSAVKSIVGTLREPLLGRALDAVKDDASLLFQLLSCSTDIADIDWVALGRARRLRQRVRYTA